MDKTKIGKQGRLLGVFLIILGLIAIVTISVIIFYDPAPKVVISDEVAAYSKLKGCDVDNGMVWCTINNICINPQKEKCEKTTTTDAWGCLIGSETFCRSTQLCQTPQINCPPGEYVPKLLNDTVKPVVVVNTTNTTIQNTTIQNTTIQNTTNITG